MAFPSRPSGLRTPTHSMASIEGVREDRIELEGTDITQNKREPDRRVLARSEVGLDRGVRKCRARQPSYSSNAFPIDSHRSTASTLLCCQCATQHSSYTEQ